MNQQEESRGAMTAGGPRLPESKTDARSVAEILVEMGRMVVNHERSFEEQKYSATLAGRQAMETMYQLKKEVESHAATTTELGKQYELIKKLKEQQSNYTTENVLRLEAAAKIKDERISDLMALVAQERYDHHQANKKHGIAVSEWAEILEERNEKIDKLVKAIDRLSAANIKLNKKLKVRK